MNLLTTLTRLLRLHIVHDAAASKTAATTRSGAMHPEPHHPQTAGAHAEAVSDDPGTANARLHEWLRPQQIVLDVDATDRRGALETAAAQIGRTHALDPAPIFRALWRREQVGSTALGQGVAIPHARISGIARPLTIFMRPRFAVAFDAPDGKPVSNILVIMVPEDGDPEEHLQLLAAVAEAFGDSAFRKHLAAASTEAEIDAGFAAWAERGRA
jgi:PTS system nitrogen regulatory IIA component